MLLIEEIIKEAYKRGASDIHLVSGMKPIIRVKRNLQQINDKPLLKVEDLWEIYDYIIQGNVDMDDFFKENRKLDTSLEWNNIRLRVNASYAGDKPIFTMRIIPTDLPKFDELGLPEIIRTIQALQMADCSQGATPANWMPGQPVIMPPPTNFPILQERLQSIEKKTKWYELVFEFSKSRQKMFG